MLTCTVLANGDLELTADATDILDRKGSGYWCIWSELFEQYATNGSFELFNPETANPFVGLTGAPCIAETMTTEDDGTRVIEGRLWWFPDYQIIDPLDKLRDDGRVVFTLAPTKLEPVRQIEDYAVIIRAIWCRGQDQADATAELKRRGLWLSDEQKQQAAINK